MARVQAAHVPGWRIVNGFRYSCGCFEAERWSAFDDARAPMDRWILIHCPEHQSKRKPMPEVKEEFAIQDKATGEWYVQPRRWIATPGVRPGVDRPAVWYVYADACQGDALRERSSARVVSAPPREMTEEECWEWFKRVVAPGDGNPLSLSYWYLSGAPGWAVHTGSAPCIASGRTHCDAIRAARRALESR